LRHSWQCRIGYNLKYIGVIRALSGSTRPIALRLAYFCPRCGLLCESMIWLWKVSNSMSVLNLSFKRPAAEKSAGLGDAGPNSAQHNSHHEPESPNSAIDVDSFISYAKADEEFVLRLYNALKERHKESWVVWDGATPDEDSVKRVYAAIEAAQAVIVVLSPDWLGSESCKLELAHAVACNKRLVPIVCREVAAHEVPKDAAVHNWIFFREGDDFGKAMDLLIQAMDTDSDWVWLHTRLLTRSVEWDNNNRNASYALRGHELQQAENWLRKSGTFKPPPTQLQTEYIGVSRMRANMVRFRSIAGGITLAFAAAVLILIVAQNRQRANLYLAQDLRAQAVWALTDRDAPSAEVLLAKSIVMDDRHDTRELFVDAQSHAARLVRVIHNPGSSVATVSRDGSDFITEQAGGSTAIGHIRAGSVEMAPAIETSAPKFAAFSPDNALAAIVMHGRVDIVDVAMNKLRFSIPDSAGSVTCAAFNYDRSLIATAGTDLTITTWNATTGVKVREFHGEQQEIDQIAFSPNGRYLCSGGWENIVFLWDVASGRLVHRLVGHEDVLLSCLFSPDNTMLATGSWDNTTRLWDVASGGLIATIRGSTSGINALAFSSDGRWLYTGSQLGVTRICDLAASSVRLSIPSPGNTINAVAALPDQGSVMTAGENGDIQVWDVGYRDYNGNVQTLRGHTGAVTDIAFTPNSREIISAGQDETLKLWNLEDRTCVRTFSGHTGSVHSLAISPDGTRMASAGGDWTVRIWDMETGACTKILPLPAAARIVQFVRSGSALAVTCDDGVIRLYDTDDYRLLESRFLGYWMCAIAVSSDGTTLAVGTGSGTIHVISASTLQTKATLYARPGQVWGLSFSPDDKRIYAVAGRTLSIWDIASERTIRSFGGHGVIWGLAMEPSGNRVVTAGVDATVRVWNMQTGSVQMLGSADSSLTGVAWSPSGTRVAACGLDHAIRIWTFPIAQDALTRNPASLFAGVEQQTGLTVTGHQVIPLSIDRLHGPHVDICTVRVKS